MANKFHLDEVKGNLNVFKRKVPVLIARQSRDFFDDSFKQQGWTNRSLVKWKEVQRRIPGTMAYRMAGSDKRRTDPILYEDGELQDAVHNSIRDTRFTNVELIVRDVPYAYYHNEGTYRIPKRQFMGDSEQLRMKQRALITNLLDKVWG